MSTHRTEELVFLILQFLDEEGYHSAARMLEMDSGVYFDMAYFEELVLHGNWDEADKYLSSFTKYDDNRFSTKTYFEMRKQNYLEVLDKDDHAKALQILKRDLKVFASYNGELFKEMTQLLTLDNIRKNKLLGSYIDEKTARRIMVVELKKLINANPLFEGKLCFPKVKIQRLRCLINQGLNWQQKELQSKETPHTKTTFVDHACQSITDLLPQSAENSFEQLSTSLKMENSFYGWFRLPTTQSAAPCEGEGEDLSDAQPDQREEVVPYIVTDLPKHVIWTFNEDSSPTSIDFHPIKHYNLLVGTSNGDIGLWDVCWRKKLQSRSFKVWNIGACSLAFKAAMVKDPHMSVNRIAWSPDGSLFGAAYSKHMVQLYHYLGDGAIQQHLEIDAHIGAVNDLAFLVPDQQQLVIITCGDDRKIKAWDAASGVNKFAFEGHTSPVYSICPNTKEGIHFVYSTSLDGKIKAWVYNDFGAKVDFNAPSHGSTTMAYSSDGRRLFSCGTNANGESFLAEWNENEGAIGRMYKGLGQNCSDGIRFDTSKNKYLAVGDEHMIKFWDMDYVELLTTTDAGGNLPARPCICFNPEGTLLAVIAKEKTIKILVTDSPPDFSILLPVMDDDQEAWSGALRIKGDTDSSSSESGDNDGNNLHEDMMKLHVTPNPTPPSAGFADGTVSSSHEEIDDSSDLKDSNPKHASASSEKSKVVFKLGHASLCVSLKLPASLKSERQKISRLIYTNAGDAIIALVAAKFVHMIWKWPEKATAKTCPELKKGAAKLRNQPSTVPSTKVFPCSALTKNDCYLLSASGGRISLFDIVNLREMLTFSQPPPVATCIAFHPQDSNLIAIGMDDSTICIYHIRLNKVKAKLVGHSGRVTGLAFSNSLDVLVSSGKDAQIFIWEVEGWKMQRRISLHCCHAKLPMEESDTHVQFHQDQMHFLVVSKTHLAIYNAKTPEYINQWIPGESSSSESRWTERFPPRISHATFSSDSQMVYVSFFYGSVMVLDALELEIRYTIDRNAYLPRVMSCDTYPTAIAAHPQIANQFAVGLSNGEVFVVEPAEDKGQWGLVVDNM